MNDIKIMDVSLRDGGYLNNWRFDKEQLKKVALLLDTLKLDYIELGYINDQFSLGMDDQSALHVLEDIKENLCHAELALMVNPKYKNVKNRFGHFADYITFIRIPSDFTNIKEAMALAEHVKQNNIKVSLNLISITQYNYKELLNFIISFRHSGLIDMIYIADSRGSLRPYEVIEIFKIIKPHFGCSLGFHAHDNLHLAIANTLASIQAGCKFVDGSVAGYGLGGGNARLDLLLKRVKGLDTENDAIFHQLIQTLDLMKPHAFEMELYRCSAEKNLEQEWVPILYEKYRMNTLALMRTLSTKNYKNDDDIHEILLKNSEEFHANQRSVQ